MTGVRLLTVRLAFVAAALLAGCGGASPARRAELTSRCAGGATTNGSCLFAEAVRGAFVPPLPGSSTVALLARHQHVVCSRDGADWRCVNEHSPVWVTLPAK